MSKPTLLAVGGGVLSGLLYISVVLGSPGAMILAYMAQLPLFLVGLSLGVTAGAAAGVVAVVVAGLAAGLMGAALFGTLSVAPAVVLVRQALLSRPGPNGTVEWYPPGLLVTWLTAIGSGGFLLAGLLAGGGEGLRAAIRQFLSGVFRQIMTTTPPENQVTLLAEAFTPFFPALVVGSWAIMIVINAVLAQGVLARFGWNLRPSPDIAALELSHWLPLPVAGAGLLVLVGQGSLRFFGQNLVVMFSIPFFFLGLAVMHALLRGRPAAPFLLVLAYAVMLLFGWPALAVVALGFVELWAGLRRRLAGPGPDQEER